MNEATRNRLLKLNQDFYRAVGDDFDQTRGAPWPGWERVWGTVSEARGGSRRCGHRTAPTALSVLDVGCGNGRFGVFLAERVAKTGHALSLHYHGLDTDAGLLARAREALTPGPSPSSGRTNLLVELEERDAITYPPDSGAYDLVVLFGVLHHVPGSETRQALLRALADRVAPGGLLAFACWRFLEYRRFRDRIVPWPDDLAGAVQASDHLLDWRGGEASALRYCHYVDETEHAALVSATGLTEIDTYRADGRSGDMNRYSILRKT